MLGAIIGDIIGSRWEFNPTNDYDFELFSSQNDFTDDTICTIAVADALLHCSDDYGAYIHKWCRRYPHPMGGYGRNFAKWVASKNPQPYGSYGNGSAMRISPVGMWFDDEDRISIEAEKVAACTHNHHEGIKGAQAIARAVYWAVKSFDGLVTQEQMDQEIAVIVSSLLVDYDYEDLNYEDYRNKFDETCQGTVPVALDIICKSNSFEDAVRRAVSLGADADTLGAIVGSIAEHIWGIPNYMIDASMSYLPTEMQHVVNEFYEKCHRRATYKPRRTEKERLQKKELKAIMYWKLGHGNFNKIIQGENTPPGKENAAISSDWKTEPMPESEEEVSIIKLSIPITYEDMTTFQKGHIPQEMEDHWFMYCDGEYIRYYRSWSGQCAFEAHYHKEEECYIIDELTINHALAEFGVNGDEAGVCLFRYLLTAETGGDEVGAWQDYIDAWDKLDHLYSKSKASAMNKAKSLINNFVEERLQGHWNELVRFDFSQLRGDKKYGVCSGHTFDCDNTKLSKAIYLLVFKDVWNDLSFFSLEKGMYRGDTINTFNTTFGKTVATGGFAGLNRFKPDEYLQQRVLKFHSLYHTIGNFMVLPNARVGRHTLNTFRGSHYLWKDYIDKFIAALHLLLTSPQSANNEPFHQLIAANIKDFEPYCHPEGFELLMDKLLLKDCINSEGKPKQLFDVVYHWDKQLTRDVYLRHANQYLDFCESFIEKRGAKMVEILASQLG